jgi:hypothetical protein
MDGWMDGWIDRYIHIYPIRLLDFVVPRPMQNWTIASGSLRILKIHVKRLFAFSWSLYATSEWPLFELCNQTKQLAADSLELMPGWAQ